MKTESKVLCILLLAGSIGVLSIGSLLYKNTDNMRVEYVEGTVTALGQCNDYCAIKVDGEYATSYHAASLGQTVYKHYLYNGDKLIREFQWNNYLEEGATLKL